MVCEQKPFLSWHLILATLLFHSCARPRPASELNAGQTLSFEEKVKREFRDKNVIFWDDNVLLTWNDFRKNYDSRTDYHALSATGIYSFWDCTRNRFSFIIGSVFDRDESWVMSWVQFDRKRKGYLLNHEQLHFDLTELYARKLRRTFVQLPNPCARDERELKQIVNDHLEEFQREETRYDEETRHGLDNERQYRWDRRVREQLHALRQFRFRKYVLPRQ